MTEHRKTSSQPVDRDDRVRELAYRIWEEDGRPDGHHEDHWLKAAAIIDAEASVAEMRDPDWLRRDEDADQVTPLAASEKVVPAPRKASRAA